MSEQPFYVVFAGVNGAGKSTLFRSDFWHTGGMPATMARVNPDEILREQGGDWSNGQDQVAAGRIALRSVDEHLAARRSFNQETTLAGHRALRTMAEAREKGYRVFLFYIGLANEGIALQRIERRVQAGGHDIDEALVRKRYRASLANLSKALPYCEEAHRPMAPQHARLVGRVEVSGSMASRSHRRRIALETIVARPTRAFGGRGRRTWALCGRRACSR